MKGRPKYFVYQTNIYTSGGGIRQAKLLSKMPEIKSPMQDEPFGVNFELTYQINPRFTPPDNYVGSHGFTLYSKRLIDLMEKYDTKFEKFPVKMVDKSKKELLGLEYFAFHLLEGVQDGIDEKASSFDKDNRPRIKKLILDYSKFDQKPLVLLDKVYIPLMREDLKDEIAKNQITGFGFLSVDKYIMNEFGFPPNFED